MKSPNVWMLLPINLRLFWTQSTGIDDVEAYAGFERYLV